MEPVKGHGKERKGRRKTRGVGFMALEEAVFEGESSPLHQIATSKVITMSPRNHPLNLIPQKTAGD